MNFLFVGSKANLDLNRIGGIESTMRELLFFLKKRNHDITVLLIDLKLKKETMIISDLVEITVITTSITLARKHLFKKYDVINFIQTPFENPFFALSFLVYKTIKKKVTTKFFFTYPTLKNSTFLQKQKLKFLIDHTFVFSKRMETLAKHIVENVTMLYPPVSEFYIKSSTRTTYSKTRILYAGRLSKDKGLDVLINVYKYLPRERYELGIIGYFTNHNDYENYFEKISNLKLDYLKIDSHNSKNKSPLPLDQYDILLLPYQDLGPTLDTPLLILEGLSSNCKVITSNIESLNSIEGNIYFVNDYSNYLSYIEMINNISDKENLKTIQDYSTNNFGEMYLQSLRSLGLNV
jgi:glycosyltransferase involved in cell wall biosynthesis